MLTFVMQLSQSYYIRCIRARRRRQTKQTYVSFRCGRPKAQFRPPCCWSAVHVSERCRGLQAGSRGRVPMRQAFWVRKWVGRGGNCCIGPPWLTIDRPSQASSPDGARW